MIKITGLSGFVGSNLNSYLLNEGHTCEAIRRDELNRITVCDIGAATAMVHLAGKAHDLKKTANPDEYYQVNFELTKKLYDAFLQSSASKFIFVSSVKAAADRVKGILTEEDLPDPQTHYGKSKLMAEQYIQSQPLPAGKSCFILRPCMIHGSGNKGNLNLLYKLIRKGIPYPLAGFDNKRSFLSIQNLCFVINELITRSDIETGIYNVADDEALPTSQVVTILARSLGKKPKLWNIPPAFIRFMAKLGDNLKLPLTTERLDKLTESYIVSNSKIKKALNKNLPLTAVEGLQITGDSFVNS